MDAHILNPSITPTYDFTMLFIAITQIAPVPLLPATGQRKQNFERSLYFKIKFDHHKTDIKSLQSFALILYIPVYWSFVILFASQLKVNMDILIYGLTIPV